MNFTTIGFWGAYPELDEPTSGYLIQTAQTNILLECGSGVLCKLQEFIAINDIDAMIVSHAHMDHCADLMCAVYSAMIETKLGRRTKPLNLFIPKYMTLLEKYANEDYLNIYYFDENSHYDFEGVEFAFSENSHPVQSYAISFGSESKKITFTGDTQWYDGLIRFSEGSDLLISESSLYETNENGVKGHMSAFEAGMLARMSNSSELLLTHLPHYGVHAQLVLNASKEFNGDIYLADYGLKFEI